MRSTCNNSIYSSSNSNIVRLATQAMGTRFELVLAAPAHTGNGETHLRAAGQAAIDIIEEYAARYSLFRRDSLLAYINANAYNKPVKVDSDTFDLLRLCKEVYEKSEGAFDITVAPLMRALGFHESVSGSYRENYNSLEIAAAIVGMDGVELDCENFTVAFLRPGMAMDLGGVAKGFALDMAACELRDAGIECALIHGGTSSVIAIGKPPGLEGWRVAINTIVDKKAVDNNKSTVYPYATICDQALAVSAQQGRIIERPDGSQSGHILDPRAGCSVYNYEDKQSIIITAVVAATAGLADAWSTAMLVNGNKGCEPDVRDSDMSAMIIKVDKSNCFTRKEYSANNKCHKYNRVFSEGNILDPKNVCNLGDS